MTTPAAQALFDELECGEARRWAPTSEGERFAGRFVRISAGRTRYAEVAPVMTLADDETGEPVEVWLNQIALREKVFKAKPQRGELVALIYDGKHTPRGGGDDYHAFRVLVDRAAGALVDWDAVAEAVQSKQLGRSWYRHPSSADETAWSTIDDYGAGEPEPANGDGPPVVAAGQVALELDAEAAQRADVAVFGVAPAGLETCPSCHAPWPHHEAGCSEEIPF